MAGLGWGIVGFGWVAQDYMAPAIRAAGDRLVAVADPDPGAGLAARAAGASLAADAAALAAMPEVDAIYVATPNHLHRPAVEAAAASGKAVLCEKPMAARIEDALAMEAACRRAGVLYGTAFDQRHHPAHRAIRDAVAAGAIGLPTAVRIVYACWVGADWAGARENWRVDGSKAGGGALMDLAPHGFDLVEHLLGEPIVDLHALTQTRIQDYRVDDGGAIIGRTASGVLATLHVAYNCPEALPRRRLEIVGSRGQIVALNTMGQEPGGTRDTHRRPNGREHAPPDPGRGNVAVRQSGQGLLGRGPRRRPLGLLARPRHRHDAAPGARLRPGPCRGRGRSNPGARVRRVEGLPADLPDAARAYLEALPAGRIVGFPLAPLDRTGVPAWKVALFLDDAVDLPGAMPSGYGYGESDGAAIVGALAEIAEGIWPTLALRRRETRIGSYRDLARELGPAGLADPLTLCLPAGSPVGHDTTLAWTTAVRARTGEAVLVPLDVAACDVFELPPGYAPFTTLITNGLGAGPDLNWAVAHGLLECLQRDGNGLLFRALDQGVVLDLGDAVEPGTRELLDRLDGLGIEVLPKFATDEFGFANVYVVGYDREGFGPRVPIMLSACGEACDPDRDRALRKAVLEFCSARVRKTYGHGPLAEAMTVAPPAYIDSFLARALPSLEQEETRALAAMMEWAGMDAPTLRRHLTGSVLSQRSHKSFAELPVSDLADTRARGRFAREQLEQQGFDVLHVDCSPPDRSIGVAKVIVPGLEVETMSYYRIGERNAAKLIARDSPLIRFGTPSATLLPVRLTDEARERLGGEPLLDVAEVDRVVGPLYPLYREPEAHHVGYRLEQRANAA